MSDPSPRVLDSSGYLSQDTIAAIATALGGAVAIVRVSGPGSYAVMRGLLENPVRSERAEPGKLFRSRIRDGAGGCLDDGLVVHFKGPVSYTGEDSVEFHIHGGAFLASRLMELLAQQGVRQALPGEFSFRAIRNGKMTLPQAEAIADLIVASNERAVSLAVEKLEGSQGRLVRAFAEDLRRLATLAELGIDFSDQDVDEVSLPALKRELEPVLVKLKKLRDSYGRGSRIQNGIRVAFVGLPNAGKSSFFNALLGEDRSIVSEVAGTTRDVVREHLTLRGRLGSVTLRLEDTAGLRSAADSVEKVGVERTRKAAREADLILLLVDGTADLEPLTQEWKALGEPGPRALGILTKCDLINSSALDAISDRLKWSGVETWVRTSAVTGAGVGAAAASIADFCEKWVSREQGEVLLTRLDHLRAVNEALNHLDRALLTPEVDLFAADLRQSLCSLSPLIGDTVPDDILGRIFSDFCIGK